MLNTVNYPSDGPRAPVLIVHGLYGSARNWGVIAKRLSATRPVLTVDMRNHGESPHLPSHSYADLADDLAQVITAHGGPLDVVGHSMGGKAAMMLALTRPELVSALIVADIAPVAYSHSQIQYIKAMRAVDLATLSTRAEAEAALARTVDDPSLRAFFLQSLDLRADPPRWKLNLDVLAREMPQIVGWPGDIFASYTGRTLFLSGSLSEYVKPDHRTSIRALFPSARFAKITGAGHWLHAEKPREFETSVAAFLDAAP